MNPKATLTPASSPDRNDDLDALYHDLLRLFYDDEDREASLHLATRLEAALQAHPDVAESIQGDAIGSLLAEVHGDFDEAIRKRESEIRKIRELHRLAQGTPGEGLVLRQYGHDDLSDRLDLLAALYGEKGELDRAVAVLEESRQLCEDRGIPFDGQDLLDEFREALGQEAGG
jgi:hypothetical protein